MGWHGPMKGLGRGGVERVFGPFSIKFTGSPFFTILKPVWSLNILAAVAWPLLE